MTKVMLENLPQVRGEYKFDEPLSKHTWLGVGGKADVMFLPEDEADLQYFLQNKPQDIPVFIIGGGSNLLVRDGGIRGAVIKLSNRSFSKWQICEEKLYCGAGLKNFELKKILPQNGLSGLEFLCSIPGTIGGAFRSNAGCFGSDLAKVLHHARVMDASGHIFKVELEDFHFAYRYSDFPQDWIILEVCLQSEQKSKQEIEAIIAQNDEYRKNHQPQGIRTAGSTFKNPEGFAAWRLIKEAGCDTLSIGGVKMSDQHCNFLQNDGTATAEQIEQLCEKIIEAVYKHSGVKMQMEVKRVGERLDNDGRS